MGVFDSLRLDLCLRLTTGTSDDVSTLGRRAGWQCDGERWTRCILSSITDSVDCGGLTWSTKYKDRQIKLLFKQLTNIPQPYFLRTQGCDLIAIDMGNQVMNTLWSIWGTGMIVWSCAPIPHHLLHVGVLAKISHYKNWYSKHEANNIHCSPAAFSITSKPPNLCQTYVIVE